MVLLFRLSAVDTTMSEEEEDAALLIKSPYIAWESGAVGVHVRCRYKSLKYHVMAPWSMHSVRDILRKKKILEKSRNHLKSLLLQEDTNICSNQHWSRGGLDQEVDSYQTTRARGKLDRYMRSTQSYFFRLAFLCLFSLQSTLLNVFRCFLGIRQEASGKKM